MYGIWRTWSMNVDICKCFKNNISGNFSLDLSAQGVAQVYKDRNLDLNKVPAKYEYKSYFT